MALLLTMEPAETDILAKYADRIEFAEIDRIRRDRLEAIDRTFWSEHLELAAQLPELSPDFDLTAASITVGATGDLSATQHEILRKAIESLIPWRKGPFTLFGQTIDAEWRSDRKWNRIAPVLGELDGKRIADFGCGNAYYLFRLLGLASSRGEQPEFLLGVDPSERFYLAYQLVQRFVRSPVLQFELLGVEHASLFPELFDLVLCLGVIYHQRDPLTMLQQLRDSLSVGGRVIIESQAVPGGEPTALFVPDRYAKARNVYFVPTAQCLVAWMERAGFRDVEVVSFEKVTFDEQRRTPLAPYESLADFLHPADPSKTIEGFPAPYRVVAVASK